MHKEDLAGNVYWKKTFDWSIYKYICNTGTLKGIIWGRQDIAQFYNSFESIVAKF